MMHRVLKLAFATATLLAVALGVAPTHAQQVTTLIQFTNVWKYDQSGLELGTAWRTNDYDDSPWPSGPGLLGFEDNFQSYAVYSPLGTRLTVSSAVTTFYFRASFNFAGTTNGLSLIATNLVDDGCVVYLNGLPAGGVRATAAYNATTTFAGPAMEGQLDVVTLTNVSALRSGENLLAVEVHQSASTSGDIMWGTKLMAFQALPLVITNQPHSWTVSIGDPITFFVGVSGGPAFYRWEKDGVLQPSTSNSLSIVSAQLASTGNYRVIVTNSVSAVTSSVATLTVVSDTFGPRLLAAIGNNTPAGGGSPFGSNTINVLFDEPVNAATARNTNNYAVTRLGTTDAVRVLSILYSTALGVLLNVDASDPNWTPGGDYVLTVSNVTDTRGNVIAPDSQIAVSWPQTTNVIQLSHPWCFHNSAIFEPGLADTNWYACDFVQSFWWSCRPGPFCGGVFPSPPSGSCFDCQEDTIGFQPEPALFRTWFYWPASLPTSNVTLLPRFAVDDGTVFYLNGVAIYRYNMPGGPVNSGSKAIVWMPTPACVTSVSLTVTNLVAGSNCFAAAVFQANSTSDADVVFALELDARYALAPRLPPAPAPVLGATLLGANQLHLSWTGHGFALESATNLSPGSASYPLGPWQQVTNMSNPYTNRMDEPQRFFRLKK